MRRALNFDMTFVDFEGCGKFFPQTLHHWQGYKIKQAFVLINNRSQKIDRRDDS
jgi:hypothetical protein